MEAKYLEAPTQGTALPPHPRWVEGKAIGAWSSGRDWITAYTFTSDSDASQRNKFRALADEWRSATGHMSSPSQKAMHPAYQQIIAMGPSAIPLILEDLRQRGGHWYFALRILSQSTPVPTNPPPATAQAVRDAWLRWGREHRYIL